LKETYYEEKNDSQAAEAYGIYGNCPDCGAPLNDDNVGGNGFCINCAENH
jgi:hypothetical protein